LLFPCVYCYVGHIAVTLGILLLRLAYCYHLWYTGKEIKGKY
jgi:hypothetical protein